MGYGFLGSFRFFLRVCVVKQLNVCFVLMRLGYWLMFVWLFLKVVMIVFYLFFKKRGLMGNYSIV